jgi:hypothetical protein
LPVVGEAGVGILVEPEKVGVPPDANRLTKGRPRALEPNLGHVAPGSEVIKDYMEEHVCTVLDVPCCPEPSLRGPIEDSLWHDACVSRISFGPFAIVGMRAGSQRWP